MPTKSREHSAPESDSAISGARPALFPNAFAPMLASPAQRPSEHPGWIFEPKLDGIRCLVFKDSSEVRLQSRRGLDLTRQYPDLLSDLNNSIEGEAVVDGEIVALDSRGCPSFQLLQQRMNVVNPAQVKGLIAAVPVAFFAFDVVHANGLNLMKVPLRLRKELLQRVFTPSEQTQIISHFEGNGPAVYEACLNFGFEGIVAKRAESAYEPGRRSEHWLKIKPHKTAEFVIGGYTVGEGGRNSTFGALLLGYYNDAGSFVYAGSVGTGFTERLLAEIAKTLEPLKVKKCPFVARPNDKPRCVWTTPQVVAEVKFMEWTMDGKLRAPVFLRFRPDIPHHSVVRS